jgi:hypothetical protein
MSLFCFSEISMASSSTRVSGRFMPPMVLLSHPRLGEYSVDVVPLLDVFSRSAMLAWFEANHPRVLREFRVSRTQLLTTVERARAGYQSRRIAQLEREKAELMEMLELARRELEEEHRAEAAQAEEERAEAERAEAEARREEAEAAAEARRAEAEAAAEARRAEAEAAAEARRAEAEARRAEAVSAPAPRCDSPVEAIEAAQLRSSVESVRSGRSGRSVWSGRSNGSARRYARREELLSSMDLMRSRVLQVREYEAGGFEGDEDERF